MMKKMVIANASYDNESLVRELTLLALKNFTVKARREGLVEMRAYKSDDDGVLMVDTGKSHPLTGEDVKVVKRLWLETWEELIWNRRSKRLKRIVSLIDEMIFGFEHQELISSEHVGLSVREVVLKLQDLKRDAIQIDIEEDEET